MASQHLPPQEDARLPVLRASADANWRQHNPELVEQLEKSGSMNRLLDSAAERAVNVLQQAEERGVPANQAEELANEELYLPAQKPKEPQDSL